MKFNFDYIKHKNITLAITFVLIVSGLFYGITTGYKFDIDFKGGTRIQVDLNEEYTESDINEIVSDIIGYAPDIQKTSSGNNSVSITTQTISEDQADEIINSLESKYKNMGEATTKNVQPSYGKELLNSAIISILISVSLILVYIAIRFKTLGFTSALSAVIALLMDALFMLAIYGIFKFPINSTFVAVVLTVVGYSINDTIIVYDRIRENKRVVTKNGNSKDVINNAINQTMGRTMITSLTTICAIAVVLVFSVVFDQDTLRQFSIPLIIGIAEGTFSSIFVASNLWYTIDKFIEKHKKKK